MTMIASKNGSKAKIVKPTGFDEERSMQEYIHENPESIPIHELSEDKKLLILKREFQTNSGPIDALAIDNDGEIYIIETKLFKNPDKRTVIAQALDYGAALWAHQIEITKFFDIIEKEIQGKFRMSFEEKAREFFDIQDDIVEEMKIAVQNNLKDGKLKFIILMDSIDSRLKDLIVYVNQNSKFDIYGVQFKHYELDNYEIVIPKIFGAEVKKNLTTRSAKILWDKTLFFMDMRANVGNKLVDIARAILDWYVSKETQIQWGAGAKIGTFYPTRDVEGKQLRLFGVASNGKIEIVFQSYPLDRNARSQLIQELNSIGQISIPEKAADTWASFPLSYLESKPDLERFFKTIEKLFPRIAHG